MNTELNPDPAAVDRMKEKLVSDLKGIGADVDNLLKEVTQSTAEDFAAVRTRAEEKLRMARSRLAEAQTTLTEKLRCSVDATHDYASRNPWRALCGAAVIGFVAGILLSRR
ncbi:YqjD family protein [Azoarcus sp. DD4]|uniref:DUF883 family protein n=1 Tax=Azoarcus sp. DD4 TaxID=2027405 RepID=UPI00143D5921|nr:DUF883 family protein [Azoarcus sp. DD4]